MSREVDALRDVNLDWTRQLKSVWHDPPYHVQGLHDRATNEVIKYFVSRTVHADPPNEPLGRVIVGPAGFGKTHLVGELRRQVWAEGGWFVLLDFIGIKDFWSSVALGFIDSLQNNSQDGTTQCHRLVLSLARLLNVDEKFSPIGDRWRTKSRSLILEIARLYTRALARKYPGEAIRHLDVMTALILLNCEDLDCQSTAHGWLQSMPFDDDAVRDFGFKQQISAIKVVEGLSWIMSRTSPTLIAVDQIDAIVTASNTRLPVNDPMANPEQAEAQNIVGALTQGLLDLHDKKHRAVTVIACLETTWEILSQQTLASMAARYCPPLPLGALANVDIARALIVARLREAFAVHGFAAPSDTWPFTEAAFESAIGLSPRQLLQACDRHVQSCISAGQVVLCTSLSTNMQPERRADDIGASDIDEMFKVELSNAILPDVASEQGEAEARAIVVDSLNLLTKHYDLPEDIDVEVHREQDQKRPSLHGRLSFTFTGQGSREEHYCFRLLEHTNPIAFQSRLKAAITSSGIDTALKFRRLLVLRRAALPGGVKTKNLVEQFLKLGGKFLSISDQDLRTCVALSAMTAKRIHGLDLWLFKEKPLFKTRLFQESGLCPPPFLPSLANGTAAASSVPVKQALRPVSTQKTPAESADKTLGKPSTPVAPLVQGRVIPMGIRYERGIAGAPVVLDADLLSRHIAVLAGPGSGKTVLLRRIIEEAALHGIPSIVLDPNNDLSRLGDRWPTRPQGWDATDEAKAQAYHDIVDVVIWTPGVATGNPLSLNLLPDFSAIDDSDERSQAIEMTLATLGPYLGGGGQMAHRMRGVLADAIRYFATSGGGALSTLVDVLRELPDGVSGDSRAQRLAQDIADALNAAMAVNPLLSSSAAPLDPRTLFEGPTGKTRVSVINFAGLASDEARDSFVNRLQMSLFTFIKRNPSQRSLYVIDEAQNFAPSGAGTACKASALSLAAQARKYGLGMLFATQTPKGIDNKIVSNCTTHLYGRMNAPATLDAIHLMMEAKGGGADDVGKLSKGEFYFSTEGSARPFKVRTPLCLSWHPANPPTAAEVIEKARKSRVS